MESLHLSCAARRTLCLSHGRQLILSAEQPHHRRARTGRHRTGEVVLQVPTRQFPDHVHYESCCASTQPPRNRKTRTRRLPSPPPRPAPERQADVYVKGEAQKPAQAQLSRFARSLGHVRDPQGRPLAGVQVTGDPVSAVPRSSAASFLISSSPTVKVCSCSTEFPDSTFKINLNRAGFNSQQEDLPADLDESSTHIGSCRMHHRSHRPVSPS